MLIKLGKNGNSDSFEEKIFLTGYKLLRVSTSFVTRPNSKSRVQHKMSSEKLLFPIFYTTVEILLSVI